MTSEQFQIALVGGVIGLVASLVGTTFAKLLENWIASRHRFSADRSAMYGRHLGLVMQFEALAGQMAQGVRDGRGVDPTSLTELRRLSSELDSAAGAVAILGSRVVHERGATNIPANARAIVAELSNPDPEYLRVMEPLMRIGSFRFEYWAAAQEELGLQPRGALQREIEEQKRLGIRS